MNKKYKAALSLLIASSLITACGGQAATDSSLSGQAQIVNTAESTLVVDPTDTADTTPVETSNETQTPETEASLDASILPAFDGYCFVTPGGEELRPATEADQYEALLGSARETTVAPSCAFDGEDIVYVYDGYEVQAGALGGVEYLTGIILNDESVSTPEGLHIGSSLDEMLAIYGDEYTEIYGQYVYEDETVQLVMVVDPAAGEVLSISYIGKFSDLS